MVWAEAADALLSLLAPLTPHVTAEIWEQRHPGEPSVHLQRWPTFDPALVRDETVTMVVQVNGKLRDKVEVSPDDHRGRGRVAVALASPKVVGGAGRPRAATGGRPAAPPGQRRRLAGAPAPAAVAVA